jgi:uncharacterized membrane protein
MIRKKIGASRTLYIAACLTALLFLREALASEAAPSALPPLQTLAAQERLVGIAEPGQNALVTATTTLDSGEGFARVRIGENTEAWVQVEGALPIVGESLAISKRSYLFSEPVVEMADDGAAPSEEAVSAEAMRSQQPLVPGRLGVATGCTKFIDSNGYFGTWGAYLMGRINRSEHPNLLSGKQSDLGRVCPKFNSMNELQKKNFLVWMIAGMAAFESACNERVQAKGVNGIAAGLLQLHKGKEYLYGCRSGMNALNGLQNLECGLVMLDNDVGRTGKFFPSSNNYWQVLRPQSAPGKRTLKVTRAYGPCF